MSISNVEDGIDSMKGKCNVIICAKKSDLDGNMGSHNLIISNTNLYSSCGGLVVGCLNKISKPYASVTGGL